MFSDVMKHPFMLKESSTEYTKGHQNLTIDSGRGTMSTEIMSRMSGAPKTDASNSLHSFKDSRRS
jgi:hypothetical protein